MPLMENTFHCSNGHTFVANAKLRTRCPECGVSTKRSFDGLVKQVTEKLEHPEPPTKTTDSAIKPEEKPKPKTPGPVLVRQGRPRMAVKKPVAPKPTPRKPTIIGSKVSAGLVKSTTIKRRGVMPTIKRRPVKTAVARGIQGREVVTPYWHGIADKYGI